MLIALMLLGASSFVATTAYGQAPHIHGVTVPDWYSNRCCNNNDCRPVEPDGPQPEADRIGTFPNDEAVYKYDGLTFTKRMFRNSQDERFHVCIDQGNGGTSHPRKPLCIYIPREATNTLRLANEK